MKKLNISLSIILLAFLSYLIYFSFTPFPVYVTEEIQYLFAEKMPVTPLLFTGDIMLGRFVEVLQKTNNIDPFGNTTELLKSHTTISNLEGTIPEIHVPTVSGSFYFSFSSSTPRYLQEHGIKAVSLANNHSFDYGRDGYEHTKTSLDIESIFHFGGYDTTVPDYFETKLGTTTVIVYGINMISNTWNEQTAHDVTKLIRQKNPDALLIVFIHWGNEYELRQNWAQENFAHLLIDEGVNAIVGSHPHVTEGIEIYKNSPIFYSLGNFIFDQYFSVYTQRGYMLSLDKQNDNFVYTLIPVTSKRSVVSIAEGELRAIILETISKSSSIDLQKDIKNGKLNVVLE